VGLFVVSHPRLWPWIDRIKSGRKGDTEVVIKPPEDGEGYMLEEKIGETDVTEDEEN
jgi:hypothetical protein